MDVARPLAVLRAVPRSLADCALTFTVRTPIDVALAARQHAAYRATLEEQGFDVVELPAEHALPDSVFVEDVLIATPAGPILTAPGEPGRRAERVTMARAFEPGGPLSGWGPLRHAPDGVRLDGGDVLAIRDVVFVGLSSRTDQEAVRWLASALERPVVPVEVTGRLHLKTAVTSLTRNVLIADPQAVDLRPLNRFFDVVRVAPGERAAANVVRLPRRRERITPQHRDERVLMDAAYPRAIECVRRWGVTVIPMDISEFAKAEAGLTCLSVLLGAGGYVE